MKTKIITLQSHDDLISVRDQLSWAKTPRILLIWSKYEKVNLRLLDLKILQRHADSLGAQLGLVTRRMKVRRDAESLGIPVFKSTSEAQRKAWNPPAARKRFVPPPPRRDLRSWRDSIAEKESAWRTSLPGRIAAFALGVAAVLALVVIFIPRARVIVYPETRIQSALIPIRASEANAAASITGEVPARKLSVVVNAERLQAVTSVISVPKSKSQGIARFTNLSQSELVIPAQTVVSTADEPPLRFVALHDTLLKIENQFVDAPIESYEAGAQGNVGAGAIKIVEGGLGLSLAVTNLNPLSGGADLRQTGASEEDRARLRSAIMEDLRREAQDALRAQIQANDILLLDSIEISETAQERFTPAAGEPGKTLTLAMQVEFSARYISADDLNQLALVVLDSSLPAGFDVVSAAEFKAMNPPALDSSGAARFDLQVSRTLMKRVNAMSIISRSRGHEPAAVQEVLSKDFSPRQPAEVIITPAWWKWTPLIPLNISVAIQ